MAQQMETTTSIYNTDSIIDEDNTNGACVDSGYSSLGSLTHVSPINGSSLRPSVSHYLQPIYENEQINSFTASELTPTSQSIRRISEFHITSPISSLKRSATPSLPSTPIKFGSPKKMRLDGKRKAHLNLIDNIHVDENSENRDIGNFEFSPIKAANVLQNRNGKFERKGSFSSTPIYEESLLKSLSVSKTDFFTSANRKNQTSLVIRKTKSFSPSKHSLLVQRYRHIPVQTTKPIPEDEELPCTPARKSFKRMLCRQDALESSPQPSCSNLFDTTATDSFNESDINLESPLIFKSPSPSPPQPTSSSGTPIKKIRRNLSFNLAQPSPKKELDKIIFSKIPCSPRKLRAPATKRSSTTKDVAVVAKRPQLDLSPLLPKRASYAHLKHFDIFSHLAETTTAIQKILSYVEPKDIYHMYNVCQQWRTIIKNDTFASDQRSKFHRSLARNKENLQRKPLLRSRTMIPKSPVSRSPLKRANSVNVRKNSLRKMPTQSSFDEETLLLIKEDQRRTKCPICSKPSIISKSQTNDPTKINENRIPFQRSKSLFASKPVIPSNIRYEVAECTNKGCAFRFCMNCDREFHGNNPCQAKTFIAPMDSDDEGVEVNYSTVSRKRSSLRRLCRLGEKVKFSSLG